MYPKWSDIKCVSELLISLPEGYYKYIYMFFKTVVTQSQHASAYIHIDTPPSFNFMKLSAF